MPQIHDDDDDDDDDISNTCFSVLQLEKSQ